MVACLGGGALALAALSSWAANERALRLYRGRGFREVCELHGWRCDADAPRAGEADDGVQPLPLSQACERLDAISRRRGGRCPGTT